MPALLPHPSLLAHTVYQSLAFDDALRGAGFSLTGTTQSLNKPDSAMEQWDGTSEIILGSKEWFDAWLDGERNCQFFLSDKCFSYGFNCEPILAVVENQYNDIISSPDAWQIADDGSEDVDADKEMRPTISARRVKALIEQITGTGINTCHCA